MAYTPIANGVISEFDISLITGIEKLAFKTNSSIFPNPTSSKITVTPTKGNNFKFLQVFSVNGAIVIEENLAKNDFFTLDVSALKCGIYLLKLITNNGTYETYKFEKY